MIVAHALLTQSLHSLLCLLESIKHCRHSICCYHFSASKNCSAFNSHPRHAEAATSPCSAGAKHRRGFKCGRLPLGKDDADGCAANFALANVPLKDS
jgi:hypothetical protein